MTLTVQGLGVELGGCVLVEDFQLKLESGRVNAVVGESGSGKTLSALAVLGLLPADAITRGTIVRDGLELLSAEARRVGIAMVLQEPSSALNPVLTVGRQLTETLAVHRIPGERRALALDLLAEVGLPRGEGWLEMFPHQLSGGQRQRVLIACALAAAPRVLIADEPTASLDASVRGVILSLLRGLARNRSLAVWLISHDLQAMRAADEVTVMYAGRIVEHGTTSEVLEVPRHPYTAALFASDPTRAKAGAPLPALAGSMPMAADVVSGCRFHPRCPRAIDRCRAARPLLQDGVACHLAHPPVKA